MRRPRIRSRVGQRPKRLATLRLFDVEAGQARGGAKVLTRLAPFTREAADLPVHGHHEFAAPRPAVVPASYVARLRRAVVMGANSAVVCGRTLVLPGVDYLFEHRPQLFAEYFDGDGESWTVRDNPSLHADARRERGVLITGRYSHNYFHFVIDALQAVCLADRVAGGVPLVVDGRIPRQAHELLALLAPAREVITVPPGEFFRFDELYLAVAGSFSPDDPHQAPLATYETRLLPEARTRILERVPETPPTELMFVSRRQYLAGLAGRSYQRDALNSLELEDHVTSLGGRVIFPEELTAAEQAAAFRSARIVIAPSGSAVANLIFCEPGTAVITLHQNRLVNPWYFGGLATGLGLRWRFAVGDPEVDSVHSNYTIARTTLDAALEAAGRERVNKS